MYLFKYLYAYFPFGSLFEFYSHLEYNPDNTIIYASSGNIPWKNRNITQNLDAEMILMSYQKGGKEN